MSFKDEIKDLIPGHTDAEKQQDDAVQKISDVIKDKVKEKALLWRNRENMACSFFVVTSDIWGFAPEDMWLHKKTLQAKKNCWTGLTTSQAVSYVRSDYSNMFFNKLSHKLSKEDGFSVDGWQLFTHSDHCELPSGSVQVAGTTIYPADLNSISSIPNVDANKPFSLLTWKGAHNGWIRDLRQDSSIFRIDNDFLSLSLAIKVSFKV